MMPEKYVVTISPDIFRNKCPFGQSIKSRYANRYEAYSGKFKLFDWELRFKYREHRTRNDP